MSVALVTGAASGIGRSTAQHLASRGFTVAAVDRNAAGAESTAEDIRSGGGRAQAHGADITSFDDLSRVVGDVIEELGDIDAVVAAAGVDITGAVHEVDVADWERCIQINLTGAFLTAKATIDALRTSRGAFVAIASDAGTQGAQAFAPYTAAKHGVVGLVKCMALDYGPVGVRSNVICPGMVETPMARRLFDEHGEELEEYYKSTIPLGRFAEPAEVAEVAHHLLTSPYTNGVVYALDGGATAGYFAGEPAGEAG